MNFEEFFGCKGDIILHNISSLHIFNANQESIRAELGVKILQCIKMIRLMTNAYKVVIIGNSEDIIKIDYFLPFIKEEINKSIFINCLYDFKYSGLLFLPIKDMNSLYTSRIIITNPLNSLKEFNAEYFCQLKFERNEEI
jgi:hypothetical protein